MNRAIQGTVPHYLGHQMKRGRPLVTARVPRRFQGIKLKPLQSSGIATINVLLDSPQQLMREVPVSCAHCRIEMKADNETPENQ